MKYLRAACVFCLASLAPRTAPAHTISVDCQGHGDFDHIQGAVLAASSGDTLRIAPCTYEEQVVTNGKFLVLLGEARQTTLITWPGPGSTVQCADEGLTLKGLTIERIPPTQTALGWHDWGIRVEDCFIQGRAGGGVYFGSIYAQNSYIRELFVTGGQTSSTTIDSRFSRVWISGVFLQAGNDLHSSGCRFGELHFGSLAGGTSDQDSIGSVALNGGLDVYNSLDATGSTIDTLRAFESAWVSLQGCRIGSMSYEAAGFVFPSLSMQRCIVVDDFAVKPRVYAPSPSYGERSAFVDNICSVEHNTFLAGATFDESAFPSAPSTNSVRSNIFAGPTVIFSSFQNLLLSDNCFASSHDFNVLDPDVLNSNLFEDPQFCNPTSDYRLKSSSPCVGNAHDGGNIGALGVGCGPVSVRPVSWGKLKALFQP
jgi:hypothetical protein